MRITTIGLTLAVLLVAGGAYAAGEIESKVAVVDMERVMSAHPETKEAEGMLQKQADEFESEKDEMLTKFERLKKEFEDARQAADSKALSDEGRTKKREETEDKLTALRDYDNEVRQTAMLRQKQLTERKRRMRDRIVGKIRDAIRGYAAEKGLVLVLDSGAVLENAGAVLFNTEKIDITTEIGKIVGAQKASKEDLEKTREEVSGKSVKTGAGMQAAKPVKPAAVPGAMAEPAPKAPPVPQP